MRILEQILEGHHLGHLAGCAQQADSTAKAPAQQAAQQADPNVYTGPIGGKSNKAKTISMTVGKGDDAKDVMLRFDDNTEGLEYAKKGEAAAESSLTRLEELPEKPNSPDSTTHFPTSSACQSMSMFISFQYIFCAELED